MKANRILCPTDFSECSKRALDIASSLARENDGVVFIVHVDLFPINAAEIYYGLGNPLDDSLLKALHETVPSDPDVHFVHKLLQGDPAAKIVDYAKAENMDLIVMGTHGRSGLKRLIMGSVAEAVVRHAACPVLTIGMPSAKEAVHA